MARTINQEEYAAKRGEILDVVRRLIYTKGYEQMTLQDVLNALTISKGAFYHYFDSKPALLEALIERMMQEAEGFIRPIIDDPNLTAIEKFHRFISAVSVWKLAQKAYVVALLRVWFADENAIVRQKVNAQLFTQIAPYFNQIAAQGLREGAFTTDHADHAGDVILSMLAGLQNTIGAVLFDGQSGDAEAKTVRLVGLYDAYMDGMERILGAAPGSLPRIDADTVRAWIDALDNPA
jgi:AcrR family transcriptional regulator